MRFVYSLETGRLLSVQSGSFDSLESSHFPSINISYGIDGLISNIKWNNLKNEYYYDSANRLTQLRIRSNSDIEETTPFWERNIVYNQTNSQQITILMAEASNKYIWTKETNDSGFESLETSLGEIYHIKKKNGIYEHKIIDTNGNEVNLANFKSNESKSSCYRFYQVEVLGKPIEILFGNGNSVDKIIFGNTTHFDNFYENGVSFYSLLRTGRI